MNRNQEEQRIYEALSGVETPACDLESAVFAQLSTQPAHKRRWTAQRLPIAVLAAILALTLTAAAVIGLSESWEQFFGEEVKVPENIVLKLNESKTVGNYTFMIDNALVSEDSALLMLSLSRVDGKPLDTGIGIGNFGNGPSFFVESNGEKHFMGGSSAATMSPDNTSKRWIIQADGYDGESLLGQTISVYIGKIVQPTKYTATVTGDFTALGEAAQASLVSFSRKDVQSFDEKDRPALLTSLSAQRDAADALTMPLSDEYPEDRISGLLEIDGRLAFVTRISDRPQSKHDPAFWCTDFMLKVTDTRTHYSYLTSRISSNIKGMATDPDGVCYTILQPFIDFPTPANFTSEDLPYLKIEAVYSLVEDLVSEPITLSFAAESRPSVTVPLEGSVQIAGIPSPLRRAVISPLTVKVFFGGVDSRTLFNLYWDEIPITVELLYKDGTRATGEVHTTGDGQAEGETNYMEYRMLTKDGSRVFPDTKQIESLIINGTVYPLIE